MKSTIERHVALITGGCGGMGMALAREFGATHDLCITDVAQDRLDGFAAQLRDEGYSVLATVAGDLADTDVLSKIVDTIGDDRKLEIVIHAAGVSSGMADWNTIIRTNVLATNRFLDRIEQLVGDGSVVILIASIAGHLAPANDEIDALLDTSSGDDLLDLVKPILEAAADIQNTGSGPSFVYSGLSGPAYGLSKRATIRAAVNRSSRWAEKGARILSISPGLIDTPMGRYEVEQGEAAAGVLADTPLQRWGTAMDIARAARFLTSDAASFITGTDLRIDGGVVPKRTAAPDDTGASLQQGK